jgi:hypothetical protein
MPDQDQPIPNLDNVSQDEAREMLRDLCSNGFDGLVDMAALALGRDEATIRSMMDGDEEIDEDLIMKMKGIARERNIPVEEASTHAVG